MAGLDPATQWPRVCAAVKRNKRRKFIDDSSESPARTDVRALGGRVALRLPGHDDRGDSASIASRIFKRNLIGYCVTP